ncbi:MAG TPA: amino acid permease [Blastocatellia bacterium]|nr:amino acid permease [Blastocatellia bacterium]
MNKRTTHAGLVRDVGRWDVVALMFNFIVGASIFSLPSKIYALTGTYSILAIAACALLIVLVVFCFAEVSSRFTGTGGPYLYAREALGPVVGFEIGWLLWVARLTGSAAICNVIVTYLSYFWEPAGSGFWRAAVMTALIAVFTTVNIIGVKESAIVNDIFAIGKLIPILVFVGVGLFFIDPQQYSFATPPSPGSFSLAASQLIFAFAGFEGVVITAGETRDPRRNMPFAMLIVIGATVVLYILIQVVCIGTLPNLAGSERPLADASRLFMGATGASIVAAGALVSSTGVLGAGLLAGPRLTFAMAEQHQLPQFLCATHRRFHTPHVSILLAVTIVLALSISGTFTQMLTLSAIARLISYVTTCVALLVLRRRGDERPAMFRLPGATAITAAAIALSVWLLASNGWRELRQIGIAATLGLLVYVAYRWKGNLMQKVPDAEV